MSPPTESVLLDALDDVVVTFEEHGDVLDWNQTTETVTGYGRAELSELGLADLVAPEDADTVEAVASEALDAGEARAEVTLVTAAGGRHAFEFRVSRLADAAEGRGRLVAIGRDLSERVAATRQTQEVLDRMTDGFFAVDADWHLTYMNDVGQQILSKAAGRDLDRTELIGLQLWEAVPDAVGTTFYERYHRVMETQSPETFEEYYPPLDTWFDVRAYPSESGLSVYFHDSSERHRQREALETREQVLREMHTIIADGDRPFGDQVEALLELGRSELGAAYGTLSKIRDDEYIFEFVDAADDSIEAGDVVPLSATNCEIAASTEQTLVLGDVARDAPEETGRAGYQEWGISCYIGAPVSVDGEVSGTFCFYDTEARGGEFSEWEITLVDLMSRWVSYELERERANERLQHQNDKLEQFAYVVSHDLRNPLNVLEGTLEQVEGDVPPEKVERCRETIDQMTALIEKLLTLARLGDEIAGTEPVALDQLARHSWENIDEQGATLQVDVDRLVQADRTRLQQLFENLFRNAVEHGAPGPATETADRVEHGGDGLTVSVGALSDGFYVEDDGPGIPEEDRDDVFEGGYTTTTDGTGFGLAIVEEVAEAHGWVVTVTEGVDGGARFEVTT